MTTSKVFREFGKEVIPKNLEYKWTERKIRDTKPSWKDFTDKRIAISQYHLNQVKEYLERKHFCILVGNKDTGKTWLSYALGYNLVEKEKKRVRFAAVYENFNEKDAWNEIESQELRGKNKSEVYFVIEDCHINPEESEEFFQKILDNGEENLRFLFTMRKTGKVLLEDIEPDDTFYNEGTKRECIVRLLPDEMSKEHVKSIIKKFIEVKGIKYKVPEKELEDVANRWSNDLFWVWLRLISWNYSEASQLSDITDDKVCDSIWSRRGEIRLSLPERRKSLFSLSTLCQFEPLEVYELTNFLEDNKETLNKLTEEGIVSLYNWRGYGFVSIPENFADLILTTMLRKDTSFKRNEIPEQIQIFKDYLKSKSKPPNWYIVFYALFLARESEKSNLAKEILISLWNDDEIWKIVKEDVKDLPVGKIPFFLIDSLLWSEGKSSWNESLKASEIRLRYLKHNYNKIQDKMKSSSARTILRYLPLLSRVVDLNKFFDSFEISDYECIINLSTINNIRQLFFSFHEQNWNQPSAAKKMAEALPDADLARLISQENASLYRLGGLIGNVMQVDCSPAKRFVEKLSEIDLSDLFSRKDIIAEEKGFTKAKVITYFLSKWISFIPDYRKRIVSNISNKIWYHLIISASLEEAFWLFWNIYVNDLDKAKRLVQNDIGEFLLQECLKDQNRDLYFPLLGVLHLCDLAIRSISLFEIDIIKIKQMLMTFKENKPYPKSTLLVLSMVALKVKLSSQQFENIKEILDEQLIKSIQNAPDLQIREVLSNLIEFVNA